MRPAGGAPASVTSNGGMALITWIENRAGFAGVYATRVSSDGTSLDPLGIALGPGFVSYAAWNGQEFAVLTMQWQSSQQTWQLVFIDVDGEVRGRRTLDLPPGSGAHAVSRPSDPARFLFLRRDYPPSLSVVRYTIIDGHGVTLAHDLPLPLPAAGYGDDRWVAGAGPSEFLILRLQRERMGGLDRVIAERISLEGAQLSSTATGLNRFIDQDYVVAGAAGGYVLASSVPYGERMRTAWFFDRAGVYTGRSAAVTAPEPPQPGPAVASFVGDQVYLSWTTPLDTHRKSISYVAPVLMEGTIGPARAILYEQNALAAPHLAEIGGNRYAFFWNGQLMGVRLASDDTPGQMSLLATAGAAQTIPAVAASGQGFLVAWHEQGSGVQVRRFDRGGAPIGEPSSFGVEAGWAIGAVGNASTYLVAVRRATTVALRRMSAETGAWIDDAPVIVEEGSTRLASNGRDALMAWTGTCATGSGVCANVRILPMSGPLVPSAVRKFPPPAMAGEIVADVSLTSDGANYLLSWFEGTGPCPILCVTDPPVYRALRLASDGTPLDAQPIELESRRSYGSRLSSAWDGSSYIVTWSAGLAVRAVRVRSDGTVERNATGDAFTVARMDGLSGYLDAFVAGHREGSILFTRERYHEEHAGIPVAWRAVSIPASKPLADVAASPGTVLRWAEGERYGGLAAASNGPLVLTAYDRSALEVSGSRRLFVRVLIDQIRRRAVQR